MKAWLLVATVLLAGCTQPAETSTEPEWTPDAPVSEATLELAVAAPEGPVVNQQWTAMGSASAPVDLSVSHEGIVLVQTTVPAGDWSLVVELPFYGLGDVQVDATGANQTADAVVTLNALAPATVAVNYGPGGPDPVEDAIWVDLVNYAAQADYDDAGATRADYTNLHDVMVEWERAAEHVVEYSYSSSFNSFGVDSIDGVGNALSAGAGPYWCYDVDGEAAGQGISIQRFEPGNVVAWYFCGT